MGEIEYLRAIRQGTAAALRLMFDVTLQGGEWDYEIIVEEMQSIIATLPTDFAATQLAEARERKAVRDAEQQVLTASLRAVGAVERAKQDAKEAERKTNVAAYDELATLGWSALPAVGGGIEIRSKREAFSTFKDATEALTWVRKYR